MATPQAMEESFRLAKICADFLAEECVKNAQFVDTTHYTRFHSSGIPNITLQDYFRRIAKYSHCSGECFVVALRYIQRYCEAAQSALTLRNAHRLVVVATMVAAKLRDDIFYDNKYYSNIGGINGREMNELELDMLVTMGWHTWVDMEEYDRLLHDAKMVSDRTSGQPALDLHQQHHQQQQQNHIAAQQNGNGHHYQAANGNGNHMQQQQQQQQQYAKPQGQQQQQPRYE